MGHMGRTLAEVVCDVTSGLADFLTRDSVPVGGSLHTVLCVSGFWFS